jgi:hypothetical protein
MQAEPGAPSPEDPEEQVVTLLQRQMARLKRWFEWERWLLEPRSFAPPEDSHLHPSDEDGPLSH